MTFLEVIQSAPKVIQDILEHRDDQIVKPLEQAFKTHSFSSVVVIASGTSYNAAATVKKYAQQSLNVKMELFYPNMFLNYYNTNIVDKNSLVVFISQGGTTKEVYYCVEAVQKLGLKHVLITENVDGPIAQLSEVVLPMGSIAEPFLFRTIGYDATCVTLTLMLNHLFGDDPSVVIEGITKSTTRLMELIQTAHEFFNSHKADLLDNQVIIFIGTNELWPISQEAAIKFFHG